VARTGDKRDADLDKLLGQSEKEAGVADAMRVYEKSEAIYVAASLAVSTEPVSESATAANLATRRAR
jgi:hypothetical protein